jgi:hypothetical protein
MRLKPIAVAVTLALGCLGGPKRAEKHPWSDFSAKPISVFPGEAKRFRGKATKALRVIPGAESHGRFKSR